MRKTASRFTKASLGRTDARVQICLQTRALRMHGDMRMGDCSAVGGGGRDDSISTPQADNHENIDQWPLVLELLYEKNAIMYLKHI